jgi:hypothetical protein
MLKIRTANDRLKEAATQPTPNNLFNSLVFENETTILFADTEAGKSILAVQIGNEISKRLRTLYVDMELSTRQFGMRYSEESAIEETINYTFNDNFMIASFADSLEDFIEGENEFDIFKEVENLISENNIECLIFDNMSMIATGDVDTAKSVIPLMKKFKEIKEKYNLTLIIVDHTKKRNEYIPISINDLNGSKMKANLVDSVFYIGKSRQGENIRYILQVKNRSAEKSHTPDSVLECEIIKENAFLHFSFSDVLGSELDHIKQMPKADRKERDSKIISLFLNGTNKTQIGNEVGLHESSIRKILRMNGYDKESIPS